MTAKLDLAAALIAAQCNYFDLPFTGAFVGSRFVIGHHMPIRFERAGAGALRIQNGGSEVLEVVWGDRISFVEPERWLTVRSDVAWNTAPAASAAAAPPTGIDAVLTAIAKEHFGISVLETRNSDSLDFYDVAVWSVQRALGAAYAAGRAAGAKKPPDAS